MVNKVGGQAFVFDLVDIVRALWTKWNRRRLLVLSVMAICTFGLWLAVRQINQQPIGFDEGIILQAPVNMAEKNTYASFGAQYDGADKIFDPFLSTGPSVTLPIAAVFKIFGIGIIQARLVMVCFYITTIITAAYYGYASSRSQYSFMAGLFVLLVISSGINFRLDVLGEIPAVAFSLASFLYWRRQQFFRAGLLAAFAVLAKFLMLMIIMAGCLVLAIRFVRARQQKQSVLKDIKAWCIGAVLPLLAWELVRFIQTGSPRGYFISVKEFVKFFVKNGSGIVENGTVLNVSTKLDMLVSNIAISRGLLYALMALLAGILVIHRQQLAGVLKNYYYPLTFMGIYLAWWLLLSNGAYTRYTVPLALICLIVFLAISLEVSHKSERFFTKKLPFLAVIFILLSSLYKVYLPLRQTEYPITLKRQQQIAKDIERRANYPLAHIGWWQNPEVLFLTGLHSKDMHLFRPGEKYSLLLSPAMDDIEPKLYDKGLKDCEKIWLNQERYILCEVTRKI